MQNSNYIKKFKFLETIKDIKYIELSENKIIFNYDTNIVAFIYVPILALFIYEYYLLSKKFPTEYDINNIFMWFPIYFILYFVLLYLAKPCNVLDFENNRIYKSVTIFNIKYSIIKVEEIQTVCNNCYIGIDHKKLDRMGNYEGKKLRVNPRTNQYQQYFVSFLLKNGELIDFINLGMSMDDYQDTVLIAKRLSNIWNIPLYICNDYDYFIPESTKEGYKLKSLPLDQS